MNTRFTPEVRGHLVGAIRAGVSLADGCRELGLPESTARTWLRRGRRGDAPYDAFVAAVERAVESRRHRPLAEGELLELVERAVRRGSIPAVRLWLQMRRDREKGSAVADPMAGIDELAQRRQERR